MTGAQDLRRASVWSVVEVAVSGIGMFVILKIILAKLGAEALGIWSLVVASTLLLRLGDASISTAVTRFVGEAFSEGEGQKAREFADTCFVGSFVVYLFFGAMLAYPLSIAIGMAVPNSALHEATELVPYAIVGFIVLSIGQTTQATVVGLHRAPIKSMIAVSSIAVQVGLLLWLSGFIGLKGVVVAQIGQSLFVIICSRFYSSRVLSGSGRSGLKIKASWARLKDVYSFGLKMQLTQVASLGFDPAIKFVISAYFGLNAVAQFEIANRIAAQTRQVVVMPTQALLPLFAATFVSDRRSFDIHLSTATANIIFFASILGSAVAIGSPLISVVIVNELDYDLIGMIVAVAAGWMINSIAAPSFLAAISADIIRWNMIGQSFATLAAPAAIWALHGFDNPVLAIAGAMSLLALSAIMMIWCNSASLGVRALPPLSQILRAYQTLLSFAR